MPFEKIELGSPSAKHRAVIVIQAEVHEIMPSGECRGTPVYKEKKVFTLDGQDRVSAIRNLNELLQGLNAQCQNNNNQLK